MGIHVVPDGVFNHTGREFFAFHDLKVFQVWNLLYSNLLFHIHVPLIQRMVQYKVLSHLTVLNEESLVLDIISSYEKACGKKIPYVIGERRSGDAPECYADPSKAQEELGWRLIQRMVQYKVLSHLTVLNEESTMNLMMDLVMMLGMDIIFFLV